MNVTNQSSFFCAQMISKEAWNKYEVVEIWTYNFSILRFYQVLHLPVYIYVKLKNKNRSNSITAEKISCKHFCVYSQSVLFVGVVLEAFFERVQIGCCYAFRVV